MVGSKTQLLAVLEIELAETPGKNIFTLKRYYKC